MLKVKYKTTLLIIFCLLVLSLQVISAQTLPLQDTIIMVDPGHGGRDSGTYYGKIYEKNINLEISKVLEEELTKNGAIVYMTRTRDIDLSSIYDSAKKRGDLYRRIKMIDENDLKTDIYLSIHINWYNDGYWKGAEVLYYDSNSNNKRLAEKIQESLKKDTDTTRDIRTTSLYMYKYINTPGVLIECGFLSNYQERKALQTEEYQRILAKSISFGVLDFFQSS